MNPQLRRLLAGTTHGILTRSAALARVDHGVLDRAVAAGHLIQQYPRVYLDPAVAADRTTLIRAAVVYANQHAAVSHLSGLALWRLPAPVDGRIHLTAPPYRHLRGTPGLRVHRRRGLRLAGPDVVVRDDLPVIKLERCIIDSWPMLSADAQRAPVIKAVARRMTTSGRIRAELEARPRLGGRRYLLQVLDLIDVGCRSELEMWGYLNVFRGLGLRWQTPVAIGSRTVYLDAYDEVGRLNFELDGRKYHGGAGDRERDLRRDAALAALGIMVVRFTHDRLVREPDDVRDQARRIIATRRAQLAA